MKQFIRSLGQYPLVVLFAVLLLGLTAADFIAPHRTYSEMENRSLTQKPKFSLESCVDTSKTYMAKYEEYVNDQFVARDFWIDIKSRMESAIGKTENNGIVYGQDGHMFEKYTAFNPEQMEKNNQYLSEFFTLLPQGTPITFSIIPSAYEVLSDKLPYGLENVHQAPWIDKIYQQTSEESVEHFDMNQVLQRYKNEEIYYRTDHHWTTYGAYQAYRALMEDWGLQAVSWEDLQPYRQKAEGFYGTFYSKSKLFSAQPDTIDWFDIPVSSVTIDGKEADGLYDRAKFQTRDKYAAFLQGNNGVTVIRSENNLNRQEGKTSRLLLIKDSYSNSLAPFFTYSFDEVVVVDPRSIRGMKELLASETFDRVLVLYNFMNYTSDNNIARLRY